MQTLLEAYSIRVFHEGLAARLCCDHISRAEIWVDQIYLPGEMEWQHREKVLQANEITLPEDVLDSLKSLAEDYDMADPYL